MRTKTGEPGRAWTLGTILTRDYFPRLAPAIGWLWTPLGSLGMAAVAAMLCGLILHPRGFVVLAGLLVVIVLGVVWPWLAVLGLSGTLGFERRRVARGMRSPCGFCSAIGCPGAAGDSWSMTAVTDRPIVTSPTAGEGTGARHGIPDDRGDLGVHSRLPGHLPHEDAPDHDRVPVRNRGGRPAARGRLAPPRLAQDVLRHADPRDGGAEDVEGLAPRDRPGPAGDFLGVRPYRRGDSLRRIHWPQSARHDQLIVCELQSPGDSRGAGGA